MKTVSCTATFQATIDLPIPAFSEKETLQYMFEICEREAVGLLTKILLAYGGSIIGKPTVKIHLTGKEE